MTSAPIAHLVDLRDSALRVNVTSQWGENGILNAIFGAIGAGDRICLEVGAHDLRSLSTVYPLWTLQGWHAILIEGDHARARAIRRDHDSLLHSTDGGAVTGRTTIVEGFIDPAGPRSLSARMASLGVPALDLLVLDVDGLEYHIWRRHEAPRPRVVVCEFNPTIPPHISLVSREVPGNFTGSSARAMLELARDKGYSLVACTQANAVFVADHERPDERFARINDLDSHFDPSGVTYYMTSYDGGVFLSGEPPYRSNPLSPRPAAELPEGHPFYVPRSALRGRFWLSRGLFEMLRATSPTLASVAITTLRQLRTRLG